MRIPSILIATFVLGASGVPLASYAKAPPCPGGRYLVSGNPLMATPDVAMDVVDMAGRMVSVESGCDATKARVRATANGTKLRARWASCPGLRGKAVLSGTITEYCRSLTGTFVAAADGINKPFLAALSGCGDGIWDPEGGEACDAGLGPCGSLCNACSCNGVTTTTVTGTTSPTSTTTTATAPTTSTTGGVGTSTTTITPTTVIGATTTTPTTVIGSTTTTTTTVAPTTTSTSPGGTTTSTMPVLPTTSTTTTTLPGPDLVLIQWMSPPQAVAGADLFIQYTVKNQGAVAATAPWYDYILLSNDYALGNDTAFAFPQQMTTVNPNATYTVAQNTTFPKVPPGTYYLFMDADGQGVVPETNEANNISGFIQIVVVAPDLATTAFGAPASGTAGAAIAISYTVKDQGSANAFVPWTDRVWLSTDATFGGDTAIADIPRSSSVAVNGTYSGTPSVTLPMVAPGTYFLFFQADTLDQIYEGGAEANNVRGPVTITIN